MVIKKAKKPDIRFLKDMSGVLYDCQWAKTAPNLALYYMYRGVKKENGLRYDITVIPPLMLGQEFVKTKGHEHSGNYGEIYIVLQGKAIFLMQKTENNRVKDVYAIKGKKGELAIIPPGYAHITINPSAKGTLKIANWLSEKSQHSYDPISKKQGAGYYYTKQGWIENKKYGKVPRLYFKKPLKKMPKDLGFLYGKS